jgi:hypothetical protein
MGEACAILSSEHCKIFRMGVAGFVNQRARPCSELIDPILVVGNPPFFSSLRDGYRVDAGKIPYERIGIIPNGFGFDSLFDDGMLSNQVRVWNLATEDLWGVIARALERHGMPVRTVQPQAVRSIGQADGSTDAMIYIGDTPTAISLKGGTSGGVLAGKHTLRSVAKAFFPTDAGQQRTRAAKDRQKFWPNHAAPRQAIQLGFWKRPSPRDVIVTETRSSEFHGARGNAVSIEVMTLEVGPAFSHFTSLISCAGWTTHPCPEQLLPGDKPANDELSDPIDPNGCSMLTAQLSEIGR